MFWVIKFWIIQPDIPVYVDIRSPIISEKNSVEFEDSSNEKELLASKSNSLNQWFCHHKWRVVFIEKKMTHKYLWCIFE